MRTQFGIQSFSRWVRETWLDSNLQLKTNKQYCKFASINCSLCAQMIAMLSSWETALSIFGLKYNQIKCHGTIWVKRCLSKDIRCHERHLIIFTNCRSPTQMQSQRVVSPVIVDCHFDLLLGYMSVQVQLLICFPLYSFQKGHNNT